MHSSHSSHPNSSHLAMSIAKMVAFNSDSKPKTLPVGNAKQPSENLCELRNTPPAPDLLLSYE